MTYANNTDYFSTKTHDVLNIAWTGRVVRRFYISCNCTQIEYNKTSELQHSLYCILYLQNTVDRISLHNGDRVSCIQFLASIVKYLNSEQFSDIG